MKFSYSKPLGKYVASELGTIIDTDDNFDALLTRHGILEEDDLSAEQPEVQESSEIFDFDTAFSDADDDLAVIREFLED